MLWTTFVHLPFMLNLNNISWKRKMGDKNEAGSNNFIPNYHQSQPWTSVQELNLRNSHNCGRCGELLQQLFSRQILMILVWELFEILVLCQSWLGLGRILITSWWQNFCDLNHWFTKISSKFWRYQKSKMQGHHEMSYNSTQSWRTEARFQHGMP